LTVIVPPESRFYEHKILDHGIPAGEQIHPTIYRKYSALAGTSPILGVAVDIGTKNVVDKLLDMVTGRCLATQAMLNPQTCFGDDVVSRINYVQSEEHLAQLHNVIVECINALIRRLCRRASADASSIYEASIVGNTTMNHIFLRLPVEQLGRAPYRAWSVEARDIPPAQLGIEMNPAGNVHCAENIAGFVGADTTAVALAVDMDSIEDRVLAVDIGTNGEIVLGAGDRLYAASCAAGPALEGARIQYGSRAVDGAVEAVVFDEDIVLDTIGEIPPRSICGSAASLTRSPCWWTSASSTGRAVSQMAGQGRPAAAHCFPDFGIRGQPAFCLRNEQTALTDILLTQKDIREVQLAKAAIRAGIRILMNKLDMGDLDIDRVLLAGAFGNYIRPSSAIRIGLLPNVPLDRIESVGNAAATGAEILLISEECRQRAAKLARRIQYIEIAHEKDFTDLFADAMLLSP
jgi:uncharacterized 2Fe-2S/4Fe-4S cluster protein (DUF4445 family)